MNNHVTLIGNLTRDPELRYLTSGAPVCNFGLAVNRRYQKNDEWVEEVSFFDVVVWRDQGENVAESLGKGDRVIVTGRLDQRRWENAEGENRSKIEVTADEVAASYRWATGSLTKITKSGGGGGGAESPPDTVYDEQF